MASGSKPNNAGAIALVVVIAIGLAVVFFVFPPWQVANDAPDKAQHAGMTQVPVAIWWAGSVLLAAAVIYAIMRNRTRSPSEKLRSEQATQEVYAEEEREAQRKDII
jgi:flagellar biosynthesis/type III secretory pathway M-ring protein FliF/YscJ